MEQLSRKHILISAEQKTNGTFEYKSLLVQLLSLKQAASELNINMCDLIEETVNEVWRKLEGTSSHC